jgi:hypothetical protein
MEVLTMRRIKKSLILTVVVNSVLFTHLARAVPEAVAAQADVELQQVALFKNGLGFFISQVTCPNKKDSFSFVPAAAASHGTFWVSYPPKVNLESLTAKEFELDESIEAISIEELLRTNVGKEVQLSFDDKGETTIHGVLSSFAENRSEPQPNPYAPGSMDYSNVPRYYIQPPVRASLIIVKTNEGDVAIDSQQVRRVKFTDGKVEKTFISKRKSMQLDVKLGAPAGGKKLTVSYLAKGITWAPSYIVDITEPNKAQMSAKAEVINEACDLNGVTIQLVTGFPNLQFADIVSPLAMKENLAQFLQSLAKGQSERGQVSVMSNVMTQSGGRYREDRAGNEMMPAYGAAEAGKVAEDLFMYPVKNVQLKKGQVGYFPLFTESVPYKHIYQWKIPDYVTEEESYSYRPQREQEREPEEKIWHCLKMENTTKVPWTTAPAEIVKENLILGQDTLNYTPVKGESTLKITQAVSVKAEQVELETDRKRDAAQLYGYHYDLITVEGKLSVTNFQEKAITLEITKTLSGEVKSSEPQAEIETLARGLSRMNAVRKLTWTTELEPGQQKQLGYIYEVYIRR